MDAPTIVFIASGMLDLIQEAVMADTHGTRYSLLPRGSDSVRLQLQVRQVLPLMW